MNSLLYNKLSAIFRPFAVTAALALVYGSWSSCSPPAKQGAEQTESPILPQEAQIEVDTLRAVPRHFDMLINTTGKIRSEREQPMYAENNGAILQSNLLNGKVVTVGQLLLLTDTQSLHQKLERAYLSAFNAQKEYESQLLGYQHLLEDKSPQQTADIRKKLKIASGLAGAEQDVKDITYDLNHAILRAPFSGMVSNVKVQTGSMLKTGDPMFILYDPYKLLLETKVLETDIGLLHTGMHASVTPVSFDEKTYDGIVNTINPYVEADGMVTVTISINQAHHTNQTGLFPGMNCTTLIKIPQEKAIVVPKSAVVMRGGRPVVFSLEGSSAIWNYVSLGKDNGSEVVITSGLKPLASIIISNNLQLADHSAVKASPAAKGNG